MSDSSSSELVARLVTAAVGIPILLYLIFWAPKWGFYALVAAAGGVGVWEYCTMTYGETHRPGKIASILACEGVLATLFFAPSYVFEALLGAALLITVFFLFAFRDKKEVSRQIAFSLTALVNLGAFFGVLLLLHNHTHGSFWVLITLVTVWSSDTGAYFTGRAVGVHPLYEAVSPNKTIEGSLGGLLAAFVGAYACNLAFASLSSWETLSIGTLAMIAVPAAVLGQIGDLAMSVVKRAHEVKDSGSILYGHGGLLDRIDGLIFAAPWFYVCVIRILPHIHA